MTHVDIFSGFLGAGKTTLIKKLIDEAYKGERLVLIENEFGDIGIDGGFLRDADLEITEMNSGCICCSLVGDFGEALGKALERFTPDRVLIEPSGVGKLSEVITAVRNLDSDDIELNSAATVVDAARCKMYMKNFGEFFNDQIESASCIVLSHTSGMSDKKISDCVELLRTLNADAPIVTTPWDELDGSRILAAMEQRNTLADELENMRCCDHDHDHHHHHHDHGCCDHDHDHHHHDHGEHCCCGHDHHHHHHADEVFTSWGVETAKKFTADELSSILAALEDEARFGTVLRTKGIVAGASEWLHFDYVPGEPDVRTGSADVTGRICVIGAQIDGAALKELFGV